MDWQLAQAKNQLSEVITLSLTQGPQRIRRRNDTVVIVAETEWEQLLGKRPSFKEFLMTGENFDGLDLSRDQSPGRDIEL